MVYIIGDDMSDEELKAMFDNYNKKLYEYQSGLERDFPKPYELTSYIQALEQFAAKILGTKSRQETYIKVVRDPKKKRGRKGDSAKITEKQFNEMNLLFEKYHSIDGDTKKRASERAGFDNYDQFKYYEKTYNK